MFGEENREIFRVEDTQEASGGAENWKFALSEFGLLCCYTFYLTEFCGQIISWCPSHLQGGKAVITECMLDNTVLFLKQVQSRSFHTLCGVISKCTTGVCKFIFLLSSNPPVNKKPWKRFGARAETYFFSPLWLISIVSNTVSSRWCIKDGWNKKVVF